MPDAADAALLGDFVLRPQQPGAVPAPFIIDYNTTLGISALSGEIWDIDGGIGTEQWQVDVLDAALNVLASQISPLGSGSVLDSRAWTFAFSGLPAGVDKVRLSFIGTKTDGVGLAFNNFSPFAVPEPGTAMLVGFGLSWLASRRSGGRAGGPSVRAARRAVTIRPPASRPPRARAHSSECRPPSRAPEPGSRDCG